MKKKQKDLCVGEKIFFNAEKLSVNIFDEYYVVTEINESGVFLTGSEGHQVMLHNEGSEDLCEII